MRHGHPFVILFLLVTLLVESGFAKESKWIRVQSPHFELFTTANEKQGKELVQYFEQIRELFGRLSNAPLPKLPVRIVAFRNKTEYKPFAPTEGVAAWYNRDETRDYIVMSGVGKDLYPVAVHEYTHLLIRNARLRLPIWLNEGLAEVYSTVEPVGAQLRIGNVIPGRAHTLANTKWIPWETVLRVDHRSPEYNEKERLGPMYAQSWLLTHMLYFGDEYRPKVNQFLMAVDKLDDSEKAFREVYGKTLEDVKKAADAYYRSSSIKVAVLNAKLETPAEAPVASPANRLQTGVVLAEVNVLLGKAEQARAEYEQLAKEFPKEPSIYNGLAFVEGRSSNDAKALEYFQKALELGSDDARYLWAHARLLNVRGRDNQELPVVLSKVISRDSGNMEARLLLAGVQLRQEKYVQVIANLEQVKVVKPEHAPYLFQSLAYAYMKSQNFAKARTYAQKLQQYGSNDIEKRAATSMLQYLDQAETVGKPAPAADAEPARDERVRLARRQASTSVAPEVQEPLPVAIPDGANPLTPGSELLAMGGLFRRLDCNGETAVLALLVGSSEVKFLINDPSSVMLKGAGKETVDFRCGAQKNSRVIVRYKRHSGKPGVIGEVKGLEFLN
ncbi:MAG TPA: hypothetical protein VE621_19585 [Bryobacteraceae bacterium]|nr:hypothetical protein [Bryobacteraceae bacterium]